MRLSHLLPPVATLTVVAAVAAPDGVGTIARAGAAVYAVALGAGGVDALRQGAPPADAAVVAPILLGMHLAWGAGFIAGCVRWGPPVRGVLGLIRGGGAAA
jgi:hypothetical protein